MTYFIVLIIADGSVIY